MAQKPSLVSVYTCRSSRLSTSIFLSALLGIVALVALIGVAVVPVPFSPDGRAVAFAGLGILAAYGIVMAIRLGAVYRWIRFELHPEFLRYVGIPRPEQRSAFNAPWEKLEVLESEEGGTALRIGSRVVPLPRELEDKDGLLREIADRTRSRIPFPSVGWPDTVQHPKLDERLLAEVQRGILAGQTMQMMKRVQEATGIRSKECLTLVERLRKNLDAATGK